MARLAAYYREDFKYAPVGYGTKQSRKTAYVVYDETRRNLIDNGYVNGGARLRALASSEPSLSPTHATYLSPKTAVRTLKAKPHPFDAKIVEQSRMAIQRLGKMYDSSEQGCAGPYAVSRVDPFDSLDCESVYSQRTERNDSTYAKQKHHRSKNKTPRKLTYDSPQSLEVDRYCAPQTQIRSVDTSDSVPLEATIDCDECILSPPVSFRSDSSHGRWQQWPWNAVVNTRAGPALFLSPPSPLDSGLSSQSVTSSPSLDADEPIRPARQIQVVDASCSCPRVYADRIVSSPGRYDSGRSSPGPYSLTPLEKNSSKTKSFRQKDRHHDNDIVYIESDFDVVGDYYTRGRQVRYGKLGLLGEPAPGSILNNHQEFVRNGTHRGIVQPPPQAYYCTEQRSEMLPSSETRSRSSHFPNGKHCNNGNLEFVKNGINRNSSAQPQTHYFIDDGLPLERRHHRKSRQQNSARGPCVVITEASDKSHHDSSSLPSSSSPEHGNNSLMSPEPESSLSAECSVNNSNSVSSGEDPMEQELRRKSNRRAENEIRELEDMYRKCDLGDRDLLERAERRDLPTAHQTRSDQAESPNLARSKSDTFYEVHRGANPYQTPQRAPPLRRSGVPDIIGDDMALRKHNKPATPATFNPSDNGTMTYMLCSSHFTPTVSMATAGIGPISLENNPDVEYDDLCYRKHYFGKGGKMGDPQPPFGIPLRPPPPRNVYSDYLHAVPADVPRPLCHPRGNPDVVRDDMAFRTLRKDEPMCYYDPADVYRKKRG